mmetsp:Transcript_3243/g.4943  ORF Transcript_3243/g.4943 Transcript_3243/m.4943 type:complete len:338 (+) Transcript_3243:176-1189(+)
MHYAGKVTGKNLFRSKFFWFIVGVVSACSTLVSLSAFSRTDRGASAVNSEFDLSPHISSLICRNFSRPRVAHCIAGLVRTLNDPIVHRSLKNNLVDSFGGEPVVFLNLRPNGPKSDQASAPLNDIALAVNVLQPAKVVWHSYDASLAPLTCAYKKDSPFATRTDNFPMRCAAQLKGVQECYSLVKEYESSKTRTDGVDFKFDWVFRVRTDTVFLQPLLPFCLYRNDRIYAHHVDFLNLVPRKYSDKWFNALDFFYTCNGSQRYGNPESFLTTLAEIENITLEDHPLLLIPKRTHDEADGFQFCNDWKHKIDPEVCMRGIYDKGIESRVKFFRDHWQR